MMEIQIKKTVKAGNSSAVVLPKAWLNKEVRVELVKKTPEGILSDTIDILREHIDIGEIIGVYLVGSYAREEQTIESDIDILVVTNSFDKEMISEGAYNILIVSKELLEQKLREDLLPIGAMLSEARPLLNLYYLSSLEVKVTKRNVKWYIESTEDKLRVVKDFLNKMNKSSKKYIDDRVIYTLVLRIRTLYIIEKMMKEKDYSKEEFVKLIRDISGSSKVYDTYTRVKNDIRGKGEVKIEEAERLCEYLEDYLWKIRKSLSKL